MELVYLDSDRWYVRKNGVTYWSLGSVALCVELGSSLSLLYHKINNEKIKGHDIHSQKIDGPLRKLLYSLGATAGTSTGTVGRKLYDFATVQIGLEGFRSGPHLANLFRQTLQDITAHGKVIDLTQQEPQAPAEEEPTLEGLVARVAQLEETVARLSNQLTSKKIEVPFHDSKDTTDVVSRNVKRTATRSSNIPYGASRP
jgi:hypothetical protein